MNTMNKETLKNNFRNELLGDVEEYNLSGIKLVNFIYNSYFDDCSKFETFKKREFCLMSDRHNANSKSNESIINFFLEHRLDCLSEKAIEEYLS